MLEGSSKDIKYLNYILKLLGLEPSKDVKGEDTQTVVYYLVNNQKLTTLRLRINGDYGSIKLRETL